MTKKEKRIAIAKDVLKLLDAKKVTAEHVYFDIEDNPKTESLQKRIQAAKKPCEVCALGALFVSQVNKYNDFDMDKERFSLEAEDITEKLGELFSRKQMALIEAAYEGAHIACSDVSFSDKDYASTDDFHSKTVMSNYRGDKSERLLRRICKNIIKNEGTFKP